MGLEGLQDLIVEIFTKVNFLMAFIKDGEDNYKLMVLIKEILTKMIGMVMVNFTSKVYGPSLLRSFEINGKIEFHFHDQYKIWLLLILEWGVAPPLYREIIPGAIRR